MTDCTPPRIALHLGNCQDVMKTLDMTKSIIVTDPPFNINYHYATYKDMKPENEYYSWLGDIFGDTPLVVIMYPEMLYRLSAQIKKYPDRVVSWVYPSNTRRQHRDIAFFGVQPDFSKVRQPYKNPTDRRVKKLIENGSKGCKLYDWFEVNQVKNISKDKTAHPCQMPIDVMTKIVGVLPDGMKIIDPFMGSGTTGVACKKLRRDFVGVEIDKGYFEIAKRRINGDRGMLI